MPTPTDPWINARRIVVKIGSSLLVDPNSGALRSGWLASLANDVAQLRAAGKDVVLVSSGAIALGRNLIGFSTSNLELEKSQAAAAVGQISLAHAYQEAFRSHGLTTAQILLTLGDTEERRRYLNARRTIETLMSHGAIAVVNENDTVATAEIRYGDNDRLSARVASMVSSDCLVLLSDVDGLYTTPPGSGQMGRRLDVVQNVTPTIEAMAGDAGTNLSRGGMRTKIEAAKITRAAGANMVIASGRVDNPLKQLSEGAPCTWFIAPSDPVTARKRWIGGQLAPTGAVRIDLGAERALLQGKSLLPAGVIEILGAFDRGDAIKILTSEGQELGRGLVAYANGDARRIMGRKSGEIPIILGHKGRSELIHRDDMVLNRKTTK
ncbi:MAG: glutamate 5-kinase [Hyphomicrobiaceae bacterium]